MERYRLGTARMDACLTQFQDEFRSSFRERTSRGLRMSRFQQPNYVQFEVV